MRDGTAEMRLPDEEVKKFLRWNGYGTTEYSLKATYDDVECAHGHRGLGMLLSVNGAIVGAFYCPVCKKVDEY